MLSGIILLITAIVIAALWYSQTGEQRRRNKEIDRITARIKGEKLAALKASENVDVTILWGDIVTILDSLQIASKHTEGVQDLKDLDLFVNNENLIIKKQGQEIKIKDISHLQTLVDTYDSEIIIASYLNSSGQTPVIETLEKISVGNVYNSKKDVYLAFAKIVSNNNDAIFDELSLYFDSPEKYFDKFYFDLTQRGIDKLADLPDVIVLVDALARQNKVVYQDWKTELYHSLEMLDVIVDGELIKSTRFLDLVKQAKISLIGLSVLEEQQGDSVFESIRDSGYKLLSIDENSDSYALFLVTNSELKQIIELSSSADIKLHFVDKS